MECFIIDSIEKGKRKVKPIQLFQYDGLTFFVAEVREGVWTLTEYSSGCRVQTFNEKPNLTQQEAERIIAEKALSNYQYCGKTLKESVASRIKKYGVCNDI